MILPYCFEEWSYFCFCFLSLLVFTETTSTPVKGKLPAACSKCGTTETGESNCCGPGGTWFGQCTIGLHPNFDHTWTEGSEACKSKRICAAFKFCFFWTMDALVVYTLSDLHLPHILLPCVRRKGYNAGWQWSKGWVLQMWHHQDGHTELLCSWRSMAQELCPYGQRKFWPHVDWRHKDLLQK